MRQPYLLKRMWQIVWFVRWMDTHTRENDRRTKDTVTVSRSPLFIGRCRVTGGDYSQSSVSSFTIGLHRWRLRANEAVSSPLVGSSESSLQQRVLNFRDTSEDGQKGKWKSLKKYPHQKTLLAQERGGYYLFLRKLLYQG